MPPDMSFFAFNFLSRDSNYVLHPRVLCDFLAGHIRSLLAMNSDTMNFGFILFERIGNIKFRVDGGLRHDIDLSVLLSSFPTGGSRGHFPAKGSSGTFNEDTRMTFAEWREHAMKYRRCAGLLVVQPEVPKLPKMKVDLEGWIPWSKKRS